MPHPLLASVRRVLARCRHAWYARPALLRLEQAVYGSFPFRPGGYALLGASPGARPEWLRALCRDCESFGERPAHAACDGLLLARRIPRGPWMIIGAFDQGRDDLGRPGALAFHALFVSHRAYRRIGAAPFPFAPLLQGRWSPESSTPRTLRAAITPWLPRDPNPPPAPPLDSIVKALERGRRVTIESHRPITDQAALVWAALSPRARARCSLASWIFAHPARYHLAATPPARFPAADHESSANPASFV